MVNLRKMKRLLVRRATKTVKPDRYADEGNEIRINCGCRGEVADNLDDLLLLKRFRGGLHGFGVPG